MRFGPDPDYREPDPPWVMPPIVKPSAFFTVIKPKENQMSYSFSIKADTKDDAGVKVEAELGKVVANQPSHAADRQAAQDAAEAFIDVVRDPAEGECIGVTMSGSLSWQADNVFTGASVNVSAWVERK
jgi:hypothetical protein